MEKEVGRSPSGRAARPSDQAPAGLGETASVPNAVEAVRRFIAERSGVTVRVNDSVSSEWKSTTFTGRRADARMWADDTAERLWPILRDELPDADLAIPGEVLADIGVRVAPEEVPTWGGCTFVIEVLSVDDD